MSDHSAIEWTDTTWNPVTGCTKISAGCDHCYAETFAERWRGIDGHPFERGFDLQLRPERLDHPLSWGKPRKVFVNSMSDLFHPGIPDELIAGVFAVMAATGRHTYQVLTKRHGRMRALLASGEFAEHVIDEATGRYGAPVRPSWPLRNVWIGVSAENQRWADIRIPALLDTPAAVRFLSCEPLLGPVDLSRWLRHVQRACDRCYVKGPLDRHSAHLWGRCPCPCHPAHTPPIGWIIAGGESGPSARPMHPAWVRHLRDTAHLAAVPFFFKQWGAWTTYRQGAPTPAGVRGRLALVDPGGRTHSPRWGALAPAGSVLMARYGKKRAGRMLDGRTWNAFPTAAPRREAVK
jgi:protein gp37